MKPLGILAIAALLACRAASTAVAFSQPDAGTSAQPATALVMPFDVTEGNRTYLLVSHVAPTGRGEALPSDPAARPRVRAHLAFWSDGCEHLIDVEQCLTAEATVAVDPTHLAGDAASDDPSGDLSGKRGFVVVTAYETGADCERPSDDARLARGVLVGSFAIASLTSGASFGGDALGFSADATRTFVALSDPDAGAAAERAVQIQTFDPARLDLSRVILLALREHAGAGSDRDVELGPAGRSGNLVRASVSFADNLEAVTSLPDVAFACGLFTSVRRDDVPSLLPRLTTGGDIASGGLVRLGDLALGGSGAGGAARVFAFHAQAVGTFGTLASGKLGPAELGPPATPAPTPTATSTPIGSPIRPPPATPVPSVGVSPTPSGTTPTPTPTGPPPSGSPTPEPSPPAETPVGSPGLSPTPSASPTPPGGGPSPTPIGTPTKTPTKTSTPVPTPSPTALGSPTPAPPPPSRTPPSATPTPGGECAELTLRVQTSYGPTGPGDVSGVLATIGYPGDALDIPGSGSASSVFARVTNESGVSGLFQASDADDDGDAHDDRLRIGLVSVSSAIPPGALARIRFDCRLGAVRPGPGAFTCELDASTLSGGSVLGAGCTTEIVP